MEEKSPKMALYPSNPLQIKTGKNPWSRPSAVDCSPQSVWASGVVCSFVNSLIHLLGYLVKVIQWDRSNRGQAAIVWAWQSGGDGRDVRTWRGLSPG